MGRKSANRDGDEELELLRDWSVAILEFTITRLNDSNLRGVFQDMIVQTHRALENRNRRGLREIAADLLESADGLSTEDQIELDEILREKTGRGLFQEIRNVDKRISLILERGRIANEDEYRLLVARASDVNKIGEDTALIEHLLSTYGQD